MTRQVALACLTVLPVSVAASLATAASAANDYVGRYCSGRGNVGYLRLIDQCFEFFHPNPHRQNISMLYIGKEERLCENHSWYAWWVQNSYWPTFCALLALSSLAAAETPEEREARMKWWREARFGVFINRWRNTRSSQSSSTRQSSMPTNGSGLPKRPA